MRALISDPNIASREEWVRAYDHEVQARSVVKPFVGGAATRPLMAGVMRVRHDSRRGITITHGICPRYGDHDTYDMAQCAVDEAVRAHVALGGDPDRMSALDNFCWPDPVEGPETPDGPFQAGPARARLPRACRCLPGVSASPHFGEGLHEERRARGRKEDLDPSHPPHLPHGSHRGRAQGPDNGFQRPGGPPVCRRGDARRARGHLFPEDQWRRARALPLRAARSGIRILSAGCTGAIRRGMVRSCHDLADGGLWVALAESCLGGDLGARVLLDALPVSRESGREPARLLFCETPSRFLVSVAPRNLKRWRRVMKGAPCGWIGEVTPEQRVSVESAGRQIASLTVGEIRALWSRAEGAAP